MRPENRPSKVRVGRLAAALLPEKEEGAEVLDRTTRFTSCRRRVGERWEQLPKGLNPDDPHLPPAHTSEVVRLQAEIARLKADAGRSCEQCVELAKRLSDAQEQANEYRIRLYRREQVVVRCEGEVVAAIRALQALFGTS